MADFATRMAMLRARFLAQLAQELPAIAAHAEADRWDEVQQLCHGIAGRAGMFGFTALGDAARDVDEAIDAGRGARSVRPLVARLVEEAGLIPLP
jgi:HPt (histidine-containing phosphotransfer) domain-containing protein